MHQSKIKSLFDFRGVEIPAELLKNTVDESTIEKAVAELLLKYIKYAAIDDTIKAGDMVVLALESQLDKFNKKKLPLAVGSGLFHKQFEEALLGMKKAQSRVIIVENSPVQVLVVEHQRKVVPSLSDEMVVKEGIVGITTVKEYENFIHSEELTKAKEENLWNAYTLILNTVLDKSELIFKEEDAEIAYAGNCSYIRLQCELVDGLDVEQMTPEQLRSAIGFGSLADFKAYYTPGFIKGVKEMLIGRELAKEENIVFDEKSYEEFIGDLAKKLEYTTEQAKRYKVYDWYIQGSYANFAREKIYQHVEKLMGEV